ncbi:unnamed protein product [Ixodes hexagonus]
MEKLHKEPGGYTKDSSSFTLELQKFHESRGSPFRHAPRINGREVDLFALYNAVTGLGGWQKVNDLLRWDYVLDKLNFPKACVNASLALRQVYVRYLSLFEKVHFLGEDADEEGEPSSDSRNRKSNASLLVQVPMSYNRAQHDIPESQRLALGLAASLGPPSEYNKLCLSLLSGLPNEEALSLNVCTLLSNEGRHSLRLDRVPRLLDLLLAQAGLFSNDDPTLRPTLLECWQGVEGRRMERFWEDNLDAETIALFNIGRGNKDDDDELFNLNYEVGTRSIEGQRVLRIALIFHNLSFEERNVKVLARNRTFIRFVMLCALSRWSSLRQVALDTIGNLASKEEVCERQRWSCALLRLAREGVQSQDRYLVVRCLDIVARLCRQERNARALLPQLDGPLCRRIFELLTVHDLMLLIYALEALYMLSEMGRDACERLLLVHKSIGILVSLLTLDPLAYGPLAQKGMKLIETVDPLLPPAMPVTGPSSAVPPPPRVNVMPHPPPPPPEAVAVVPPSAPSSSSVLLGAAPPTAADPLDTEAFAGTWVRAMYEPAPPGCSVARNDIYAEYVTFCSKAGRKSVISASVFANCVKAVYSQTGIRRVDNANGMMSFHHDGLRKRINPLPVPIQVTSCLSITTQAAGASLRSPVASGGVVSSHSPILKAQLSAPLRSLTPPTGAAQGSSPPPSPAVATPVASAGPATPTSSSSSAAATTSATSTPVGSSNLIKSLLANKVTASSCFPLERRTERKQPPPTTRDSRVCATDSPVRATGFASARPAPPSAQPAPASAKPAPASAQPAPASAKPAPVSAQLAPRRRNRLPRPRNHSCVCETGSCVRATGSPDGATGSRVRETGSRVRETGSHVRETGSPVFTVGATGFRLCATDSPVRATGFASARPAPPSAQLAPASAKPASASAKPAPASAKPAPASAKPAPVSAQPTPPKPAAEPPPPSDRIAHNHVGENGNPAGDPNPANKRPAADEPVAADPQKPPEVVYKSSPLLNGLLDKGKVPLSKDPSLQNGSVDDEMLQCMDTVPASSAPPSTTGVSVVVTNGTCAAAAKVVTSSDLSPISDIVGSVENASKAISRSNVEAVTSVVVTTDGANLSGAATKRPAASAVGEGEVGCVKRLRFDDGKQTAPVVATFQVAGGTTSVLQTTATVVRQVVTATPQTTTTPTVQVVQAAASGGAQLLTQPNLVKLLSTTDAPTAVRVTVTSAAAVSSAAPTVVTVVPSMVTTTSSHATEAKVATTAPKSSGEVEKKAAAAAAALHHHHHHHHHHHKPAKLVYNCEWKGCERTFNTPSAVFYHACKVHIPEGEGDLNCQWEACDDMKRRRLSLFTHLQDRHCNEQVLQIQAVRRQQISQFGKASLPPPAQPPPHPGYAPDAAFLAIRRHALAYYSHRDASDEKESALAKSIRLTSALIIRNLATHSSLARRYLRRYEQQLSTVAMSPLESSRTIAQCLREMSRVPTPD